MLCSDLTLFVVIMVNALTVNATLAEVNGVVVGHVGKSPVSVRHAFKNLNRDPLNVPNGRTKQRGYKNRQRRPGRISFLDPILLKLDNVIGKYEFKKADLGDLYMGVVGCSLSRCEKFKNLIPENQRLRRFGCSVKRKGFKKMVYDLLSRFHTGIQRVDKSFEALINFEKLSIFHNKSRRGVLQEFKTDIKTLNVEIETAMMSKRLSVVEDSQDIPSLSRFQVPDNQTHLLIYEWRIIQDSRRFLREWRKNLNKVSKCWKRRKQFKRREELRDRKIRHGLVEPELSNKIDK